MLVIRPDFLVKRVVDDLLDKYYQITKTFLSNNKSKDSERVHFFAGALTASALITGDDVVGKPPNEAALFISDLTAKVERTVPMELQVILPEGHPVNFELLTIEPHQFSKKELPQYWIEG